MNSENENQVKDAIRQADMIRRALSDAIDRCKRCCFNCVFFVEGQPNTNGPHLFCKRHNGNPPPRVVCFGCDDFMPSDDVPY